MDRRELKWQKFPKFLAEWSDEIDVERANEARLRAEKRLASHDSNLDMVRADAALKRSLARIKAVN